MNDKIRYSIYLILLMILVFVVDKYFKTRENYANHIKYNTYEDTIVPSQMKGDALKGTLDQAKNICNQDENCIGIVRENKENDRIAEYYKLQKVDLCINKHNKLPKKEKNTNLIFGNNWQNYSTHLKETADNQQRCIQLDVPISIKHLKYPFDRLISDTELTLRSKSEEEIVENKKDAVDGKLFAMNGVFHLVKGLTGEGISFKVMIDNQTYYLVNTKDSEEITLKMMSENSEFKRNATFHLDLSYVAKVEDLEKNDKTQYTSIKKVENDRHYYWKINDVNKKIILINKEDIKEDPDSENMVLFEIIKALEYTEVQEEEEEGPVETEETNEEELNLEEMDAKKKELEKLEVDIRELQHEQNLKLMDVKVNVNKFKLMDLSLSDYLSKCTKNSSDNNINTIDKNYVNSLLNNFTGNKSNKGVNLTINGKNINTINKNLRNANSNTNVNSNNKIN
jgi:hypothetical protein